MEYLKDFYQGIKDSGNITLNSYKELEQLNFTSQEKEIIKKLIEKSENETLTIIEKFIEPINTKEKKQDKQELNTPLNKLLKEITYFNDKIERLEDFKLIAKNAVYKYFKNPDEQFINEIDLYTYNLRHYLMSIEYLNNYLDNE